MTKMRWILLITIICIGVLVAGFRLTKPEPETVAAAPVPPVQVQLKTESVSVQATTIEEVEVRGAPTTAMELALFESDELGFHVSYPAGWQTLTPSTTMAILKSPNDTSIVKIEAVGPLPADGLASFVDRSLSGAMVFSRQLLTVHGLPAERVVALSDTVEGQVTTFFINKAGSVFVVTGVGEQSAIELIARSFNAPLGVALR